MTARVLICVALLAVGSSVSAQQPQQANVLSEQQNALATQRYEELMGALEQDRFEEAKGTVALIGEQLPDFTYRVYRQAIQQHFTGRYQLYSELLDQRVGGELDADDVRELREKRARLDEISALISTDEEEAKKQLQLEGMGLMLELVELVDLDPDDYDLDSGQLPAVARLGEIRQLLVAELEVLGDLERLMGLEPRPAAEVMAGFDEDLGVIDGLAELFPGPVLESLLSLEQARDQIEDSEYQGMLICNLWRVARGVSPLMVDVNLVRASRDHGEDMNELNFFAHESPIEEKRTPAMRAQLFDTTAASENIAQGQQTAETAMRAWFLSPGHHVNLFRTGLSRIGIGEATGKNWVQMFGR